MANLIVVCIFGTNEKLEFKCPVIKGTEAEEYDCHFYPDDTHLNTILREIRPQVILSLGELANFKNLLNMPLSIRKTWIHKQQYYPGIGSELINVFIDDVTKIRFPERPLVSVFTPAYQSGGLIQKPYRSLLEQNYNDWEWVIYDDSNDGGKTFRELEDLAATDFRISVYKSSQHCGNIGEVKRRNASLCKGSILLELDHDDKLTNNALGDVVTAFKQFPDAGFAYSDCAEVSDQEVNLTYGNSYAFGYGSYRKETYNGREYMVSNYPNINSKTIRHIVGVPNHFRAWRKETYQQLGGHADIHVCDDYELLIRTFLKTRMIHIPKLGYIQYHYGNANTQRIRNKEIQRLVRYFRDRYNKQIHDRFLELGIEDFIWAEGGGLDWDKPDPDGKHACYIANA